MDEITEDYCSHLYLGKYQPGDLEAYEYCCGHFEELTVEARKAQKRFILGEYGINEQKKTSLGAPMYNDLSYASAHPENDGIFGVAIAEMSLAILNSGTFAGAFWTLFDYPDPFIKENGDTPEEKARYQVARYSGHGLQIRYNKHGLIRWCDDEQDYSSRAALYTMGYMAKLFKKGSRVLQSHWEDEKLRVGAVTNADGSVSVCLISWRDGPVEVELSLEHKTDKPMRRYDYTAENVPYNEFCDLQSPSGTLEINGAATLTLQPKSVTFLTTDYEDRTPAKVKNVRIEGERLVWDATGDPQHCYYRVFAGESKRFTPGIKNQIASTVATYHPITDKTLTYKVISIDRWGNAGK